MADVGLDPNYYEDITVPVGCDLVWGFTLEPWDATGTSATFNVGGSSFAMTISVVSGDSPVSTYQAHLTPAQMATLGLNVSGASLPYFVRWTDTSSRVWPFGQGLVLVP